MGLSQRRSALVARLGVRRQRERAGMVLVEGLRAVTEALDAGARVRFAVLSEQMIVNETGRGVEARIRNAGIEVDIVSAETFDSVAATQSPQGVLMVCEQEEAQLDQLAAKPGPLLVLDALQDPGNVGTLIRSAVAFGFAGVVALDGTVDPWGPKAVRASAGSVCRAAIVRAPAAETMLAMKGARRTILVATANGVPGGTEHREDVVLVVGNEGAGVRDEVRAMADAMISVRMRGSVESLNAGIAGSILMYELTRK